MTPKYLQLHCLDLRPATVCCGCILAAILFGQKLFFHTVLSLDQLTCPPPGLHSARCISCRWNCVGATSGLVFEWQVLKQSESEPWGPALLMVPTDTKDDISSLWGRKTLPVKLRRLNYSWTLTPNINWSGKVCMTSCWMLGMSRMTQHSLRGFGIEGDIHQSASRVCRRSMAAVTVGWLCRQSKLLLMEAEEETDLLQASHRPDTSGNAAYDWDNSQVLFHLYQSRPC